jgi:hypothetical protein
MGEVRVEQVAAKTAKRKQVKGRLEIEYLLERNEWNPFERVDPKILERLHKRHEQNARKFLLADIEDAPI